MRILLMGCGSIGARRAKILKKLGHEVHGYDPDVARAARVTEGRAVSELELRSLQPGVFDAALVCTPPDSGRPEQIASCAALGVRGLYVEKPLALSLGEVEKIRGWTAQRPGTGGGVDAGWWDNRGPLRELVTMGACNLRFCGGVSGLRKIPKPWRLLVLRMGQHAKFWNPAHQKISLALDSIHELDLACYLQGSSIESIRGYSELDKAEISVHHADDRGLTHIFLDRTSVPPHRDAKVVRDGDVDYLHLRTDDNMYVREMQYFIACVEQGVQTFNPLRAAAEVCARALEVV